MKLSKKELKECNRDLIELNTLLFERLEESDETIDELEGLIDNIKSNIKETESILDDKDIDLNKVNVTVDGHDDCDGDDDDVERVDSVTRNKNLAMNIIESETDDLEILYLLLRANEILNSK